jgi:thioesterase domain-containing protein
MLAQVRNHHDRNIPLSAVFQAPTIEQLAGLLEDKPSSSSALVALQPNGSKPPLVLIHGAGGGILWGYANLAAHLGSDQPVYAVQPHDATLEALNVEDLATRYITELRALQPAGPYYLGGYCFGGYVAYEMARQLRLRGEAVALLALIDSTAPNGNYEKVNWRRLGFIPDFVRNLFFWLDDFFDLTPKAQREFFCRQAGVLLKKLTVRLRRRGDRQIHLEQYVNITELPEHELSFWRLHLRAGADYVPQPYPGRITLVRTRSQPLFCSYDPAYGWGELAAHGVEVKIVPGSHENIFKEPDVRSLAEPLKASLAAAQAARSDV